jgi:hypothetical protein
MRLVVSTVLLLVLQLASTHAQKLDRSGMSGAQLYQAACAACHGADGKGQPLAVRGFAQEPPDFTDCHLTTPEADLDWMSVIHNGGPARAFSQIMPAFGEELSVEEIQKVVGRLREFCTDRGWPRGDLNLPRPFVTEKAFPENEAVLTTEIVPSHERTVGSEVVYEHRIAKRGQYEIVVPFVAQETEHSQWQSGLGDVALAYKHAFLESLRRGSIVAMGGEVTFPSGSEAKGLGGGVTKFEMFGSASQALPRDSFFHLHGGFEFSSDTSKSAKEAFARAALGKSYMNGTWGRAWTPMIELLWAREIEDEAEPELDLLPQMQVSLSTRQHILLNVGARVPLTERDTRHTSMLFYLLWDWFDGSFFSGW